jgi:hypothetical protein
MDLMRSNKYQDLIYSIDMLIFTRIIGKKVPDEKSRRIFPPPSLTQPFWRPSLPADDF